MEPLGKPWSDRLLFSDIPSGSKQKEAPKYLEGVFRISDFPFCILLRLLDQIDFGCILGSRVFSGSDTLSLIKVEGSGGIVLFQMVGVMVSMSCHVMPLFCGTVSADRHKP